MCIATICCTITNIKNRRANEKKEAYCSTLETSFEVLKSQHPSAEIHYNSTKQCSWEKMFALHMLTQHTSILQYNYAELARVGHIIYNEKAFCHAMRKKRKKHISQVKSTQNPTDGIGDGRKYLLRTVQK